MYKKLFPAVHSWSFFACFHQCHGFLHISVFVYIVQPMQFVCQIWVVCFYISSMFLVPNFQRPVSLAYIQTVTCFAFNLYMPLVFFMSCGDLLFRWLYKMVAALKAMFKLVFRNRLVTLCTSGQWFVKVIYFFFVCVCADEFLVLCNSLSFRLWIMCNGKHLIWFLIG